LLLIPLLVLPLALTRRVRLRRRLGLAALGTLAALLVLAPWTVRNAARFDRPVLLSSSGSAVIGGANCRDSYHGPYLGVWQYQCYGPRPGGDESQKATTYRHRGLTYARNHARRLPVVIAARLGRVWDVYRPFQQVRYEYF